MMATHRTTELSALDEAQFRHSFDRAIAARDATSNSPHISIDWIASPVGPLVLGATAKAVVLLEFSSVEDIEAQLRRMRKEWNHPLVHESNPLLTALRSQLAEYFSGTRHAFDLPLEYRGTEFQHRVWTALRSIPFGETRSYGAIAKALGDSGAMRAVGAANGVNPIAIVIPCHRVVNANGTLGGFGGGAWRKQVLLDLEQGQGRLF